MRFLVLKHSFTWLNSLNSLVCVVFFIFFSFASFFITVLSLRGLNFHQLVVFSILYVCQGILGGSIGEIWLFQLYVDVKFPLSKFCCRFFATNHCTYTIKERALSYAIHSTHSIHVFMNFIKINLRIEESNQNLKNATQPMHMKRYKGETKVDILQDDSASKNFTYLSTILLSVHSDMFISKRRVRMLVYEFD